jgi:hypothetical protein
MVYNALEFHLSATPHPFNLFLPYTGSSRRGSMTVPKRFGVLRFFGTLMKVIAWIILVVSVLIAIFWVVAGAMGTFADVFSNITPPSLQGVTSVGGGIVAAIGVLLIGLIYFLIFYVSGEVLHLYLAMEENTRLTAALLLRMHQDGQADTATTYGAGGFISEPYEN